MPNIVGGRRVAGRCIAAGHMGGGPAAAIIAYPLLDSGYSVKIYDRARQKLAEFGDHIQDNPVISIEFEMLPSGCGAFELVLGEKPATVDLTYNLRVDIHLFGDPDPWYSGYITKKPLPGSTEKPLVYEGYGYYNQLDNVLVNKVYENTEISAAVRDILTTIVEPKTDIVFRDTKIVNTGYPMTKIRFDYHTGKQALTQLMEYAGNYVMGVDEYREFYFKPVVTTINEDSRFWVGFQIHDFRPEEDVEEVYNALIIQGGMLQDDGTNVMYECEDQTSIALYGRKEKTLQIPSALTEADAQRWGDNQLDKLKKPVISAEADNIILQKRKIKAEGLARVTSEDGSTVYDLPIVRVKYNIAADSNLVLCSMNFGELPADDLDVFINNMLRNAKNTELIQQLNNMQLKGVSV